MIVSVHLADVGKPAALGVLRRKLDPDIVSGLRYAETTIAAPLGGSLLPRPNLGRVGLIAAWEDDVALDGFLDSDPLAARFRHGWHVRLQPTRIFGSWSKLAGLLNREEPMDAQEPAVVLTLGRLRLSQTSRFLRASAAAESQALREPALLASTGLRPHGRSITSPRLCAFDPMRRRASGMVAIRWTQRRRRRLLCSRPLREGTPWLRRHYRLCVTNCRPSRCSGCGRR
jgi:hypothetical protein